VNGTLYTGGAYGMDTMVPGSDPPEFQMVPDAPAGVTCLLVVFDRIIYVGTENGLWTYDTSDGEWKDPDQLDLSLPSGAVTDIATNGPLIEVAITDTLNEVIMLSSGSETVLETGEDITRVDGKADSNEPFWVAAGGRAYLYLSRFAGAIEPEREELGDAWVNDVQFSPDGTVYLATDSGVHRIDRYGTVWTEWTTSNGLSANDIRTLEYVPEESDLWVGAYGGVDVMDTENETMTRIGYEDGIPSNLVYDIHMEGEDVWIGTDVGGAATADRAQLAWQEYNMSTGLIADDVQALAIWNDYVLFGTDEGVTVLDRANSTFNSYTSTSSDLPANWVWCAIAADDGFFVGTDGGLAHLDPTTGTWTHISEGELEGKQIRSLARLTRGILWVGTSEGLFTVFFGIDLEVLDIGRIDRTDGLPGDEVLSIDLISTGDVMVGTSGGLAILDFFEDLVATFTTFDGLIHDRVAAIDEGPRGTFWIGTAGGLSRLTMDSWELQSQWTLFSEDIPDVYVALDGVSIEPDEPNEGDTVNITVTVSNPSGKRAIVHVGLFEDEAGSIGDEVTRDIAYTEPGGAYEVSLLWNAMGGEQVLWIVADPDDVVPETNERNNVIAITFRANHLPVLSSIETSTPRGNGDYLQQLATIDVSYVYIDLDGDDPDNPIAIVTGFHQPQPLSVGTGDPRTGVTISGEVYIPLGDSIIELEVGDGKVTVNSTLEERINFAIEARGIPETLGPQEEFSFTVHTVGAWEGMSIDRVDAMFVSQGSDPADPRMWSPYTFSSTERDRDGWEFTTLRNSAGKYDLWVVGYDDRGIMALHVEEGVIIEEDVNGTEIPTMLWALGAVIIAGLVAVIAYGLVRRRGA
ncbi:MAG: hypothetical protein JSW25_09040, partial [Thermoplasmata archaeon]